jgi:hypothetical protein
MHPAAIRGNTTVKQKARPIADLNVKTIKKGAEPDGSSEDEPADG